MNIDIKKVIISVTTPKENVQILRDAICNEKAGIIGNYTHCSIVTQCLGSFKPSENATPYIGEKNKLEIVEEQKIEVICKISNIKKILKKIREIHPYEEPAINIIPLIDENDL